MAATVFGIFEDWGRAQRALDRLHNAGFNAEETNVMGSREGLPEAVTDTEAARFFSPTPHSAMEDGATVGAVTGAAFGGAAGWALGLTLLAVPGVGPVMVAGPLLAGLAGFLAGGGAGGFIGSLTGMGVPETHANLYHEHVSSGRIVLSVPHTDRAEEAQTLMASAGALETHIHADPESAAPVSTAPVSTAATDAAVATPSTVPAAMPAAPLTPGSPIISGDTPMDEDEDRPVAAASTINADSGV
jgi:hypothetical protein